MAKLQLFMFQIRAEFGNIWMKMSQPIYKY